MDRVDDLQPQCCLLLEPGNKPGYAGFGSTAAAKPVQSVDMHTSSKMQAVGQSASTGKKVAATLRRADSDTQKKFSKTKKVPTDQLTRSQEWDEDRQAVYEFIKNWAYVKTTAPAKPLRDFQLDANEYFAWNAGFTAMILHVTN